jgi:ATP-dependent protease ClpP protease subunit
MKSFKRCVLKNNKSVYNDRKVLINKVLSSDDDYTTEKKVTLKGEEFTPWSMYVSEKTGSIKGYPEYHYLEFSLYVYDTIIDPIYYSEVFHILRLAKPGDIMNIYINSPGGDINTLCSFAAAIEETEAAIITHVDGSADSAAFVLAFMGDEIIFSEFSQLMSHNVSMSTSRMDMANIEKYAKITKETYRGMLEKYCYRVLTVDEITNICENGMEIHLTSKECDERLTKWDEEHSEEQEKNEESSSSEESCSCNECSSIKTHPMLESMVQLNN